MSEIYTLDVYSWAGLSLGAIHFYGELRGPDRKSHGRLSRPLSEDDAISINKRLHLVYREDMYELYKVKPGETDFRFNTDKQVIDEAKKQFLEVAKPGDILVDYHDKKLIYAVKEGPPCQNTQNTP